MIIYIKWILKPVDKPKSHFIITFDKNTKYFIDLNWNFKSINQGFYIPFLRYGHFLFRALQEKSVQKSLDILMEILPRYHIKLSLTKTKTLEISPKETQDYLSAIVQLNGIPIGHVKELKLLRATIHYNSMHSVAHEIQIRIAITTQKFNQMARTLQNKRIPIKLRTLLFNLKCRSVLCYGIENMILMANPSQKICCCFTFLLRRMIAKGFEKHQNSYRFVMTNEKVLQICNTQSLASFINNRQTSLLAHIIRRENSNLVKQLLFHPSTKKGPGRRSLTLLQTIMDKNGISKEEFLKGVLARIY